MKPLIYFFGTRSGSFLSYPQDHTKNFFSDFVLKSKNVSQIVLHREDNLLYYGYVRRLSSNNAIGLCLCIDCIYNDVEQLFKVFDDIYFTMVKKGDILKLGSKKEISWATDSFASESVAITEYSHRIRTGISQTHTQPLPPVDFSISVNDCLELSLEEGQEKIVDAIKRYANLYIVRKESEIQRISSFQAEISRRDKEIKELKHAMRDLEKEKSVLQRNIINEKTKRRNLMWVTLLGVVAVILGFVVWDKVLFPSEVTHYETGEFVYYGPIKDNKPHGVGVAIYPSDDEDGRKYYIGNFSNGVREDSAAILFYQDGDYYYGSMSDDKWDVGILYMNSDNSHFEGTFSNNNPDNGTWYDHKKAYSISRGKKIYEF